MDLFVCVVHDSVIQFKHGSGRAVMTMEVGGDGKLGGRGLLAPLLCLTVGSTLTNGETLYVYESH